MCGHLWQQPQEMAREPSSSTRHRVRPPPRPCPARTWVTGGVDPPGPQARLLPAIAPTFPTTRKRSNAPRPVYDEVPCCVAASFGTAGFLFFTLLPFSEGAGFSCSESHFSECLFMLFCRRNDTEHRETWRHWGWHGKPTAKGTGNREGRVLCTTLYKKTTKKG